MSGWVFAGVVGTEYTDVVWHAVVDSAKFAVFRRDPVYKRILEHVSPPDGLQFLGLIRNPVIRDICMSSEFADTIGSPEVFEVEGRQLSPSTFRYGKVLQDLVDAFPDLHNMRNIVEIGVGYGGQARVISEYVRRMGGNIQSYQLVDMPPVLHLARTYLEHFSIDFEIKYVSKSELSRSASYDLVISNYAYSEFSVALQQQYMDLILRKASRGYLTMNTGLRTPLGLFYTTEQLMAALPNCAILEDIPRFGSENYILIYGQHGLGNQTALVAMTLEAIKALLR